MSHHESSARGPDARMVDRMLFFSDAVFAIVLTIMVLELHPPALEALDVSSSAAMWSAFADVGRTLFAYVVSFILCGLWWSVHMRVTRSLHQFDWPSAIMNLVFLFSVTLIPFAASVLGEGPQNPAAWEIYWGVNAFASLTLTLLMIVVSRGGGRLIGGMGGKERLARILQSIGPGIGFAIGAYLAAINEISWSRLCWVVIPPVMAIARMLHKDAKAIKASEE